MPTGCKSPDARRQQQMSPNGGGNYDQKRNRGRQKTLKMTPLESSCFEYHSCLSFFFFLVNRSMVDYRGVCLPFFLPARMTSRLAQPARQNSLALRQNIFTSRTRTRKREILLRERLILITETLECCWHLASEGKLLACELVGWGSVRKLLLRTFDTSCAREVFAQNWFALARENALALLACVEGKSGGGGGVQ